MSIYEDYNYEQTKAAIEKMIEDSPVVGYCKEDCGKEIKQAEIELGCASKDTCSGCVLAYVADLVG
jgi:hypothetical protein